MAWQSRNPAATEPSDATYTLWRLGSAVAKELGLQMRGPGPSYYFYEGSRRVAEIRYMTGSSGVNPALD